MKLVQNLTNFANFNNFSTFNTFANLNTFASCLLIAGMAGIAGTSSQLQAQGATYRLSSSSSGVPGNDRSDQAATSHDGRYVAFSSRSSNLVPGDSNNSKDVFVKDLITGVTTRVSVTSSGRQSNGDSSDASISNDGRYVTFTSAASNLVSGDTNRYGDAFLHDTKTKKTIRISVDSRGRQGNHASFSSRISGNGRYIVYQSMASNLVSGDSNVRADIFYYDRVNKTTTRASVAWNTGQPSNHSHSADISDDGRYVVWATMAPNVVLGDRNNKQDIFLRDMTRRTTTRISRGFGSESNGHSYAPRIDGTGDNIAFHSDATNLSPADFNKSSDVFVFRRSINKMLVASLDKNFRNAWSHSRNPSISADGRYVAFESVATNLTTKNSSFTDILVKDMTTYEVKIANLTSDGYVAQDQSSLPQISGDGRYVAFQTMDDGMVPNDTNGKSDVVVNEIAHHMNTRDRARIGRTTKLSIESPMDAGKAYYALAATNNQFGIPMGGRLFPLDNDWLLSLSMWTPSVFANFQGNLDRTGKASCEVRLPQIASLLNFEFLVAYTVIDPRFPTGFRGFSNALPFTVGR